MWSCDTCGRPNHHNPLICDTCGAAAPGAKPEEVALALQRDLAMESHLRALGFWYRLGAILFAGSVLAMLGFAGRIFFAVSSLSRSDGIMAGAFGWIAMFAVAVGAGFWVLGHFLGRFVNGARIAAAVLTLVGLVGGIARFVMTYIMIARLTDALGDEAYYARPSLAGPLALVILSSLWSIAIAWTLLSGRAAQVCAPSYRTIVARTSALRASLVKSPFFVVPLMVTALMALFVLRLALALSATL